VAAATIKAMIEHPVEGTTGKTTAYRSFLWPFLKNNDSFFSDYYLERLFPDEELGAFPEDQAATAFRQFAKQMGTVRAKLPNADLAETVDAWCKPVLFKALGIAAQAGVRIVTGDSVFNPPFVVLQSGASPRPLGEGQGVRAVDYSPKEAAEAIACLIWVLPYRVSLDAVATDAEFVGLTVVEVAHRALSASGVPWAVLTNGRQFRLLGKVTAHKPRCFVEIDLDATLDRPDVPDALMAFRYWLGLFSASSLAEKDDHGHTRLNRVQIGSDRHGQEIGDELKGNVYTALEELGEGCLSFLRANSAVADARRAKSAPELGPRKFLESDELLIDIYQETLSLMYRLLFLFYAESRNLLPMEDDMYRETYSLESIRDEIISRRDDPDKRRWFGKGAFDLWDRLKELSAFVNTGWGKVIPAYNGGLFDPEQHEFLEDVKIDDFHLSRAIDLLSRTRPGTGQQRGQGRKKITYRDLDVRHLGSIYEGILEYSARIADDDLVVIRRGSGNKSHEEYAVASSLSLAEKKQFKAWEEAIREDQENPNLPRGCNVLGQKDKGSYFLVYGGRESKRKSSGSYYTPDYIVQYIVEKALGPLVRGESQTSALNSDKKNGASPRVSPLSSKEILGMKVLDPAMGSGHFLVAATEYLARAYGEALIREGIDKDGRMSEEEFILYKRRVAERCIYGVDINPMAVELAKVSLWLFTMDRGHPLSFLNHHLKCGNSLVSAWIRDLSTPPDPDSANRPRIRQAARGQINLFERRFKAKVPTMIRDLFGIMGKDTLTRDDIQLKKTLDNTVVDLKRPFESIADAWVAILLGERVPDYHARLTETEMTNGPRLLLARENRFFHWELEFPEVFFDSAGNLLENPGFSTIMGNPPYLYSAGQTLAPYFDRFELAEYQTDYYLYFIERGLSLLAKQGVLGMITPDSWLGNKYFRKLRNRLLDGQLLREVCLFTEPPFSGAAIETAVLIAATPNAKREACAVRTMDTSNNTVSLASVPYTHIDSREGRTIPARYDPTVESLLAYIEGHCDITLDDEFCSNRGIHAYRTDGYGKSKFGRGPQTARDKDERSYHADSRVDATYRPFVKGSDIDLFLRLPVSEFVSYGEWLAEPRTPEFFQGVRIAARKIIGKRIVCTLFTDDSVLDQALYIAIPREKLPQNDVKFYLGQMASCISAFYLRNKYQLFDALYPWFTRDQFSKLPLMSKARAGRHADEIVGIVNDLLNCKSEAVRKTRQSDLDEVHRAMLGLTQKQLTLMADQ
jgi:hypothetical protein